MKIREIAPEKRVLIVALIIDVIAATAAFFMGKSSWGFGFLYGYLITAINFITMALLANRYIKMDPESAKLAAMGSYFGRMMFIGVAIVILKFIPSINVWSAMIGFLALRIALLFEALIVNSSQPKEGENSGS